MEEENKNKKTIKGFEEENIEVSKFGEWVGKDYIDYKFEYENYQRILADSIPISVIQNTLEEYKEEYEDISNRNSGCLVLYREREIELEYKIDVLQEILEKGNK